MHPISWPRNDLVTDIMYPMECLSQGINAQAVQALLIGGTAAGRRAETMKKSPSPPLHPSGTGHQSPRLMDKPPFLFRLVVCVVAGYCWAREQTELSSFSHSYTLCVYGKFYYTSITNFINL